MGGSVTPTADALCLLDDYVSGALPEAEALAYEAELFERAASGVAPEALFVDRLALLGRFLQGRTGLDNGSTRAQVDALVRRGFRVHSIDLGSGGRVEISPWPDDIEIVVTRLAVDARGFDQVQVECHTLGGQLVKTFLDVQCDPEDGVLYAVCEAPLARLSTLAGPIVATVTGVRSGQRELIGSFETHPVV